MDRDAGKALNRDERIGRKGRNSFMRRLLVWERACGHGPPAVALEGVRFNHGWRGWHGYENANGGCEGWGEVHSNKGMWSQSKRRGRKGALRRWTLLLLKATPWRRLRDSSTSLRFARNDTRFFKLSHHPLFFSPIRIIRDICGSNSLSLG